MPSKFDDLVQRRATATTTERTMTHLQKREAGWRRFNAMLPPELHQRFKVACIEDQTDMSDVALQLIEEWLERRTSHLRATAER